MFVLLCPQEHFKTIKSCLVRGDLSGAGGSLVVAAEVIPAACPPVVDVEAVAEGPCEGP